MLVVKVEIWPHGDGGMRRELARMFVSNVSDVDGEYGDYEVRVLESGVKDRDGKVYCRGFVWRHRRNRTPLWILVRKAIDACFTEGKG